MHRYGTAEKKSCEQWHWAWNTDNENNIFAKLSNTDTHLSKVQNINTYFYPGAEFKQCKIIPATGRFTTLWTSIICSCSWNRCFQIFLNLRDPAEKPVTMKPNKQNGLRKTEVREGTDSEKVKMV